MQTTTSTNNLKKKSNPFLGKLLQLLIKKTSADKRIAFYGHDPLKTK
jgi:hypothetical protein